MGRFRNLFSRKEKKPHSSASQAGEAESIHSTQIEAPTTSQPSLSSNPVSEAVKDDAPQSEPAAATSSEAPLLGENPQGSIWSDAYAKLKDEETELVSRYEAILGALVQDETSTEAAAKEPPSEDTKPTQMVRMKEAIEAGLERTEKEAEVKGTINELTRLVGTVKSVIDKAVRPSPEAALAWTCFSFGLEILANPVTESAAQREGVEYVTSRIDWYYHLSESILEGGKAPRGLREGLHKKLTSLYKTLLSFLMKSVCLYHQNRLLTTLRDFLKYDDWENQVKSIKDKEKAVERDIEQYGQTEFRKEIAEISKSTAGVWQELKNWRTEQKDEECRKLIGKTIPFFTKASLLTQKGELLPECCTWFFSTSKFASWKDTPESRVLWISGAAGKGKTMLLCSIIEWFQHSRCISYFFCKESDERLNNEAALLRGLIYTITDKIPALLSHVRDNREILGQEGPEATEALCAILESILGDPLARDAIILIDALDECTQSEVGKAPQRILKLIAKIAGSTKFPVKWVVSCRNDLSLSILERELGSEPKLVHLSLEESHQSVAKAVTEYVRAKVDPLRVQGKIDEIDQRDIKRILTERANETFLWVSLVWSEISSELDEEEKENTARFILAEIEKMPKDLHGLYSRILGRISRKKDSTQAKDILRVVYLASRPLAVQELKYLVESQDLRHSKDLKRLNTIFHQASSFLTIQDNIVSFVHQSAKDFISTDGSRQDVAILPADISESHRQIFQRSMTNILDSKVFKQDIYDVKDAGTTRSELKRPEDDPLAPMAYSCAHWADHLMLSKCSTNDDIQQLVHRFFTGHFLYWMEALGWLGELPAGLEQLDALRSWGPEYERRDLQRWIHDGYRFLLMLRGVVEDRPLQIYASGLVFAPTRSLIKQKYKNCVPEWVTHTSGISQDWDACSLTLPSPDMGDFQTVFWTGNRKLTAQIRSRTGGPARLSHWNSKTGTLLRETPVDESFSNEWRSLSSMNGQMFAFVMSSLEVQHQEEEEHQYRKKKPIQTDQICVWDATTGDVEKFNWIADGHHSRAMALSTNGRFLSASSQDPPLLKIWDTSKGPEQPDQTIVCRHVRVDAMTFITDTLFAWASGGTICIEDVQKNQQVELQCDGLVAELVACSEKDSILVSRSSLGIVHVWDLSSAKCLRKFEAIKYHTPAWLVSRAGSMFASIDPVSSPCIIELSPVDSVDSLRLDLVEDIRAYDLSKDGKLLAVSLKGKRHVSLWNTAQGAPIGFLRGHAGSLRSLSFSPDDQRLASVSFKGSIAVWEMAAASPGMDDGEDHPHSTQNSRISFVPDGQRLCSFQFGAPKMLSNEGRELESTTKDETHVRRDITDIVNSNPKVYFSRDGSKIALIHDSCKMGVWDVSQNPSSLICKLQSATWPTEDIDSVALSSSGNLLASASLAELAIWSVGEGTCISSLHARVFENFMFLAGSSLVFLKDDRHIVSYLNGEIQLSDTSGQRHKTIHARDSTITALETALLNASEYLICGCYSTVKIWDVTDPTSIQLMHTLDVGSRVQLLLRDPGNSSIIRTNLGVLDVDRVLTMGVGSRKVIQYSCGGYGISDDVQWVTKDGRKIVWFPTEYGVTNRHSLYDRQMAVWGPMIAIARGPERLVVLHFKDDEMELVRKRAGNQ